MPDESSKPKKGHEHLRPQWAGRDVTEASHGTDLDRDAALHEFDGKLPRHEAEDKAYGEYKHQTHAKAAAHHLQGIKLAEAAGDNREGRKHGLMYQLHLKQLGHEPVGPVPKEVQQHLDAASGSEGHKFYNFKPHRGDIFVLDNLGKTEEKHMADTNETLTLNWERHDDNSGGYHEHLDKSEGVLYRTWEVPHGARPSQHVLVKSDGFSQRALGYFGSRHEAMAKAESLSKEGQQLSLTPNGVPATAKSEGAGLAAVRAAQHGNNGGRITEGSASSSSSASGSVSASSLDKEESTTASHSGEESTTASKSFPWKKSEGGTSGEMPAFSMAEECGKCGSSAALCKCGNLGKAELCKKCNKATNLCKCSGMTKSEGLASQAAVAEAEHKAAIEAGKALLQKSLATGTPDVNVFGTAKDGSTTGVDPQAVQQRLHNLYVAARFALDSAAKK
jgi:hypothetical protein